MMRDHPLTDIYRRLLDHFGPQHWWPGDTPLEIMVGAVLTQNTAWRNVEKAIGNLKAAGLLPTLAATKSPPGHNETFVNTGATLLADSPGEVLVEPDQDHCLVALRELPTEILAGLIRPAGYYNLKARRLYNLLAHISDEYDRLEDFLAQPTGELRQQLLTVKGVGPETADSICLYAAGKPVFVVDTYTHRIFSRHQLLPEEADYHNIQETFTDAIPADPALYNEYHALIVRLGKEFCRKRQPRCPACPLQQPSDLTIGFP